MINLLKCNCASKWGNIAPLVLRVVTGLIFALHGYAKLEGGMPGVEAMVNQIGFPAPAFFAILLVVAELGGGILLILGAFTHWVSKVLGIVAIIALVTVHLPNGFFLPNGYEYILLILAATISLMITGAGKYSLDAKMKRS